MQLTKREPRTVNRYHHPMDRLFRSFWDSMMDDVWNDVDEDVAVWRPRLDVQETADEYKVQADLPGMDKKDVHISVENGVLTIKGERKEEEKREQDNSFYRERVYGSFCRSFNLPSRVDESKIQASLKDGVLNVTLPKAEEAKPREISIS